MKNLRWLNLSDEHVKYVQTTRDTCKTGQILHLDHKE